MVKEIVVMFVKMVLTCLFTFMTSVAFYSFFLHLYGNKREEILNVLLDAPHYALVLLFACMVLILCTILVVEWTLPGLLDYFLGGIKRTHGILQKQVEEHDKLAATVREQLEAVNHELDAIRSHEIMLGSIINDEHLRSELRDAWKHECGCMINTLQEESGKIRSSITANGMRILWEKLPYFEHFRDADERGKAMYFDAVSTGNWSRVVKYVRKRTGGES